ncbi:unnamed protein product [Musa acuminata subsp. malaccensis]|uniref:(wild Malaysian banana) hypothetical protein n=1 Tax=Musa acuminata subsp. malaccensis TaxID=214687 RepID=A0A804JWJ5_MUSAM|nr:unnamed protein product [Musa acuminata subsp. malaccensis]
MGGKCPHRKVYNEILKQAEDAAANEDVRDEHSRSKRHKKRLKQMMGPAPQSTRC